ncbi:hypothetical protein ILUMI_01437, partial [Ignelater luminosus]
MAQAAIEKKDTARAIGQLREFILNIGQHGKKVPCKFGAELQTTIRDKFVSGFEREAVLDTLLEQDLTLSFEKVVEKAESKMASVENHGSTLSAMGIKRVPLNHLRNDKQQVASALAKFQKVMDSLLGGLHEVIVFIDDTLITDKNANEHFDRLKKVLQILIDAGIELCLPKCRFYQEEIEYLGYQINKENIRTTQSNIKAITEA